MTLRATKTLGHVNRRDGFSHTRHLTNQAESDAIKNGGGSWFNIGSPGQKVVARNPDGRKVPGLTHGRFPAGGLAQGELDGRKNGGERFGVGENCSLQRRASSKSSARKAASARIAKIPFQLAAHIAHVYHPARAVEAA